MKRGRRIKALDSPEIKALSDELDSIRGELHSDSLDAVRRMGLALERGARLLSKDLFEIFFERKCLSTSTVRNYRRVARLSKEQPSVYARCAELEPSNVYVLLTLHDDDRLKVLDAVEGDACATDIQPKEFQTL